MGMILVGRRLASADLVRLTDDPALASELLEEGDARLGLDLDKAWHGIHFLLAGSAWDTADGAGEAVLGGDPIGDDLGYGAPCLVEPDRVRAIAADLRAVDVRAFRARYDPAALTAADIYPGVWDEPDVLDTYLVPHFVALRTFYLTAADEGDAVLLAMT